MNLDTNCMLLVFLNSNLLRLGSPAPQTSIVKHETILELKNIYRKNYLGCKRISVNQSRLFMRNASHASTSEPLPSIVAYLN